MIDRERLVIVTHERKQHKVCTQGNLVRISHNGQRKENFVTIVEQRKLERSYITISLVKIALNYGFIIVFGKTG
jgi:transcription elongation GreA/GreB family factor